MNAIELLPGESVILSSTDNALVLTNHRVKYEASNGGTSSYKSIPLRKVSACAVTTKKYFILLAAAALFFLGMVMGNGQDAKIVSAVIAIACVVAFFLTRNGQLEVFSDAGCSIAVPTKGMKHEEVRKFAEAVALQVTKLN